MRFTLIDRIVDLSPGEKITAVKNLSLAEEYLADHFPGFPVMPGVLMLEAMTQASAWLIRASEDFAHSTVVLQESTERQIRQFLAARADPYDRGRDSGPGRASDASENQRPVFH